MHYYNRAGEICQGFFENKSSLSKTKRCRAAEINCPTAHKHAVLVSGDELDEEFRTGRQDIDWDALVCSMSGTPVAFAEEAAEAVDIIADIAVITGVGAAEHIAGDGDDAGIIFLTDRLNQVIAVRMQLGSTGSIAALDQTDLDAFGDDILEMFLNDFPAYRLPAHGS